jgi:hypothetical protein
MDKKLNCWSEKTSIIRKKEIKSKNTYYNILVIFHGTVAEWSKARHLGCRLHWRKFKSCPYQFCIPY